ncbi:MAG: response regulator [Gloeotrichia echinulata DVL01]
MIQESAVINILGSQAKLDNFDVIPIEKLSMQLEQITTSGKSKLKLLIAEDNLVNQKVLLKQIHNLGYDADAVANGQEVLELLDKIPYDLILMDCQMPILDGLETTKEIRRRTASSFASSQQPVVIAITANAMKEDQQSCLEAGMDDYLSKPVAKDKLAALLEHWSQIIHTPELITISSPTVSTTDSNLLELPLNWEHLHQLSENNQEFELELLAIFVEDSKSHVEATKAAIASYDFDKLGREAHHIKGSSGNIGATTMQQAGEKLERLSRQQQLVGTSDLVAELEAFINRIQVFLSNS